MKIPQATFQTEEAARNVSPIRSAERILADIDDVQISCRAVGHDWPKLRPHKPLPKGMRADRQKDGCYLVRETCGNCSKVRYKYTLPHGIYDRDTGYTYDDPENWAKIPASAEVTRADIAAENFRRCLPLLMQEEAAQ